MVVAAVAEHHSVSLEAGSHADDLVAHANAEDRLVPFLERFAEMHCGLHAVVWIARAVAQEKTVEAVADAVEVVVPRQNSDGGATADERAKDVGLCAEIEDSDLHVASGIELVRGFGGDLIDEVLRGGIPVLFGLGSGTRRIGPDGKAAEGSTLVPKERGDSTRIHASDARDVIPLAPRGE